ncbi:MAG TPA: helix-turn-helix domain-containing protein [Anaerolineaceae bacterium]|nr:helix-turn-helix domain-containing protein [Anaerolineaceae bacterium]
MNQPQLGFKVLELRQQKGLTQEQLAERCEVSPRTIQRIESGEVDPRAYTLHCLGEALEFDFGEVAEPNENLWLAILHLSSMLCILIIPLLLWSWKKNRSYKIDQHGRLVLNFQITMTLALFAGGFLLLAFPAGLILVGEQVVTAIENTPAFIAATICLPVPMILIGFFCMYQGVVNTMHALADKPIHYALSIPFIQ